MAYRFILRDNLITKLKATNNYVANFLISGRLAEPNIDYVDFTIEDDKIFFSYQKPNKTGTHGAFNGWDDKSRVVVSAGKFLNYVYPHEFSENEIRAFIETFKFHSVPKEYTFKVAQGEDIIKYFNCENYHSQATENTTLGMSCMRYPYCDQLFKIYSDYSDVCSLGVVLLDDKVVARGLLWKAFYLDTEESVTVMDRRYYIRPEDNQFLLNTAEYDIYKKGRDDIFYKKGELESREKRIVSPNLFVQLPDTYKDFRDKRPYPFLDTFKYYARIYNRLTSRQPVCDYWLFNKTDGTYLEELGVYNKIIPRGFVYLPYKNDIADIKDTTTIGINVWLTTDVTECACDGCTVLTVPDDFSIRVGTRRICGDHTYTTVNIDGQRWRRCTRCSDLSTSTRQQCYKCLALKTICTQCNKVVFINNGTDVCRPCYDKLYATCGYCGVAKLKTQIKRITAYGRRDEHFYCTACAGKYTTECTLCHTSAFTTSMYRKLYCTPCIGEKCTRCKWCDTYVPTALYNKEEKRCSNCFLSMKQELPF